MTSKDDIDNEARAALREIATALKSRPMRSLRVFERTKIWYSSNDLGYTWFKIGSRTCQWNNSLTAKRRRSGSERNIARQ